MYLVFDIGGTHIRYAASKDGKTFDSTPVVLDTPKSWKEGKKVLQDICREYKPLERICVAIAGEFNVEKSELMFSPNLPDWVGKPLSASFEEATGASVLLINDAAAAALGEARYGGGKGKSIVAYLTVGTGVGGARVVDGKLDENRLGFEPGHQIINSETNESLEARVSGSAFVKNYGADFIRTASKEVWEVAARDLAIGIYNTIEYWSPDIVILGGSMITKPPGIPLSVVREQVSKLTQGVQHIPHIEIASLGDFGGLYGALFLLGCD